MSDDDRASQENICSTHSVLYKDVENTERYWRNVGGMNRTNLESARRVCQRDGWCATLKVWKGQLYIRTPITASLTDMSRTHSILLMLLNTDFSEVDDVDFLVHTGDEGPEHDKEPCFMLMDKHIDARNSQTLDVHNPFLLPDFSCLEWYEAFLPPFSYIRNNMAKEAGPFQDKIPKLFYRGTLNLQHDSSRTDLANKLGPQTDIADVKGVNMKNRENFKTILEICGYKYILYTEGRTYSGRLKYQALCNSITIGLSFNYVEFWTQLLDPYYVVVKDWDEAVVKYYEMEDDPVGTERMATEMAQTLRKHLSPQGIDCYIQRVLKGYANSINWQVLPPQEDIYGQDGNGDRTFDWVSIEYFIVKGFWRGVHDAPAWDEEMDFVEIEAI